MVGILWLTPLSSLAVSARYTNTQQQHVTLAYGCDRANYEHLIGLPVSISLLSECWNDEVQAISVVLPAWVPCKNLQPHITVSWADGSAPVKANLMLEGDHQKSAVSSEMLECMIEFIEWKSPIEVRNWRDRHPQECRQSGCEKKTRSLTGCCRSHRPAEKYR